MFSVINLCENFYNKVLLCNIYIFLIQTFISCLLLHFFSVECVAGTYNVNGDGKCKLCPKTSYVDRKGSTECLLCGEGFTTLQTGSTSDYQCVNIVGKHLTFWDRFLQKFVFDFKLFMVSQDQMGIQKFS